MLSRLFLLATQGFYPLAWRCPGRKVGVGGDSLLEKERKKGFMMKAECESIGKKNSLVVASWAWLILFGVLVGSVILGLVLGGV